MTENHPADRLGDRAVDRVAGRVPHCPVRGPAADRTVASVVGNLVERTVVGVDRVAGRALRRPVDRVGERPAEPAVDRTVVSVADWDLDREAS